MSLLGGSWDLFCRVDGEGDGQEEVVVTAKRAIVQKVHIFVRDDEVRRTLDYVWSDSEGTSRILKELEKGNEDLYRFENILEVELFEHPKPNLCPY